MPATSPQLSYRPSRPEDWREFLEDKRDKVCTHKNISALGEFIPLLTNGVIAECKRLGCEVIELLHLSDIIWPDESELVIGHKEKAPKVRTKKTLSIEDLL